MSECEVEMSNHAYRYPDQDNQEIHWPAATLTRLAEEAANDCADNDEPPGTIVPPILIPEIGQRYFISICSPYGPQILFHATLTSMYQDTSSADIQFEFDNGVEIIGEPNLLPEGWTWEDYDEEHFTFSIALV